MARGRALDLAVGNVPGGDVRAIRHPPAQRMRTTGVSSHAAPVTIAWFRRDLRLADNPSLHAALSAAGCAEDLDSVGHGTPIDRAPTRGAVVPVFVPDPALLRAPRAGANRTWFLIESLGVLAGALADRGAPLIVRSGDPADVIPALAAEIGADHVFAAADVGPYARVRDARVAERLAAADRTLHLEAGQHIVGPDRIATGEGRPFSVFTPYLRRWLATPRRALLPTPTLIPSLPTGAVASEPLPTGRTYPPTADPSCLPQPGEEAGSRRLAAWAGSVQLQEYATGRNRLASGSTSRLSADLKVGLLSPLQVELSSAGDGDGPRAFGTELAWRDFYAHVLWHNPHAARGAFRPALAAIPWVTDPAGFAAWTDGRTGYPVVDAAMRQLRAAGWMPNRARMIVASFLTRDMLVDWRLGERHFLEHLVDGDVAANNGGWQWAAGTGTDAQPYFRMFNPVIQGERFDPDGAYVREWVPELAQVSDRFIHRPWEMPAAAQAAARCRVGADYPAPIVDHPAARQRALAAFASVRTAHRS